MTEDDLDRRLSALEARVPVEAGPPPSAEAPRLRRRAMALVAAPVLVLAIAATAIAGAAVSGLMASGAPGVENPGQPLAGANLECMSPPQAAAFLAAHGFSDVVWQVERTAKDPTGATSPVPPAIVSAPPEHGYVIPGSMLTDGKLHMVVDQRPGASGVGACHGMPMP